MLELKNLTATIEDKKILENISYNFEKGKLYAIMGPNGSGKSTMATAIAGKPSIEFSNDAKIILDGEDIVEDEPHERAQKGIFLSFQSPFELSGVTVGNFLRYALDGKMKAIEVRKKIKEVAAELNISDDLLKRSLGEGFSGGEKKKMEVLQAALLNPKVLILDEIDTGVDVDSLKSITAFLKKFLQENPEKVVIMITHYTRLLEQIAPDTVVVIKKGHIVADGGIDLAHQIEKSGYDSI